MLDDQARHHAPLFGNEQVMLQTGQVLEAKPSCPLCPVQLYGRHPLADRPEFCITSD